MDSEVDGGGRERRQFPAAFAVGAVIVLILFAGLLLLTHSTQPKKPAAETRLPFGAAEQTYAPNIHFHDIELSQADNLLNQKFTYATGKISNDGARTVRAVEVTIEFHDQFNQVILRETQRVVDPIGGPFPPGQQRDFQVTIERDIPSSWNQQYPSIRVTGLALE
ncbi:MAG: FxLYD domain-containing protein [Candidatus Acidiferrales bacterium]